jgi:FixJ family two-component response regulator
MTGETSVVFVVDDDPAIRRALTRLLRAAGFDTRDFPSPEAFLEAHDPATPGCAVLDVAMPGLSGLELQEALTASGCQRQCIFITGRGDIPMSVRAMKAGAVDFLTKPIDAEQLLGAVRAAVARDTLARRARADVDSITQRLVTLTDREREVMEHVVAGRLNKQIAGELGTAEKTIKVHRGRVMAKMGVRSIADLVRVAQRVGIATTASSPGSCDVPGNPVAVSGKA